MYRWRKQKPAQRWMFRFLAPTIITLTVLLFAGVTSFAVQNHNIHTYASQVEGGGDGGIGGGVGDGVGDGGPEGGSFGGGGGGGSSIGGDSTGSVGGFGLINEFVPDVPGGPLISAGNAMEEYTTINGANFQYNPDDGNIIEETTDAQGTTTQSVDPGQNAQTYNEVKADLQDDPNSEPIKALSGTVKTQSTVDLFRMGSTDSPKVVTDPGGLGKVHPRVGVDIFPDENNMVAPGQGGSSTFETMNKPAKWWKLPSGTQLPDGLQFRNDKPGHWLIEPSRAMTVDQFRQLLRQITGWAPAK